MGRQKNNDNASDTHVRKRDGRQSQTAPSNATAKPMGHVTELG